MYGEDFGKMVVPLPPIAEQVQIARFLDWKTAQINRFIRNKKRLIELLKEQKQNIINQAVTKGLNPQAPMKPSGVSWLGDIPAHWEVRKFKHSARFFSGGTPSKSVSEYWRGDLPWVSPKDMKRLFISDAEDHITEIAVRESSTIVLPEDSLLIVVRSGILRRTIPVSIATRRVAINQDIKGVVLDRKVYNNRYILALIGSSDAKLLTEWRKVGATVESIELSYMANSYLPQPPLEEQECIIAHIENSGIKYDALISRAEREIELVREYRTRLISDVVTGQVDVRGIAVPDVTPEDLSEPVDDTVDEEDLAELNPEEEPVEA